MPYATAEDGTRIYYEVTGSGEPLLLVNGQGGDHHGWDEVPQDFSPHFRVILYDHRGTGQSDKPESPPYTTRGLARDAIAILDHLDIQRAHAYGISMGGRVAQWLGIDHGHRLGALVLGCTTPGNAHGVPRPPEVDAVMRNRPTDPEEGLRVYLERFFSPAWVAAHPEYVARARRRFEQPHPRYVQRLLYEASEGHDSWDLLPTITAPTLVIHGSEDQTNMTANAPLLAERIPGAELHIVQGGRHGYYLEFREEASRVVREFLERHPL